MSCERPQGAKLTDLVSRVRAGEPLLRPRPALKPVLESVGATAKLFTKCEVETHLNEYINRKKLYDPHDPKKVHCENDILEQAFGCKEFSTENVCELLLRNLEAVSDNSDMEQSSGITVSENPLRKRKRESAMPEDASGQSDAGSPPDIPWCIGYLKPGTDSSDSESSAALVCFYKGYDTAETAVITDSEDDLFFLDEEDRFPVEYEPPESESEEEEEGEEEQQEQQQQQQQQQQQCVLGEEDPGADGGDEYDEDGDTDSEIDEDDRWTCQSCSTQNYPITQRCAKCWIQRHERASHVQRTIAEPTSLVKQSIRTECAIHRSVSNASTCSVSSSASFACTSKHNQQERPLSSLDTPRDFLTLPSCSSSDSGFSSHPSSDILHPAGALNKPTSSNARDDDSETALRCGKAQTSVERTGGLFGEMCVVCLTQPRNASIVHGDTGHQVCCFTCADKLRTTKKKCPVCREKIEMVIKNFF